jgi:Nif-specific regulatory protein
VVRRVAESGVTVVSEDVQSDPELRDLESVMSLEIKSVLCQPLTSRDQVIGAVYLDNRSRPGIFEESHRRLLRGFVRLIAGAIAQAQTRAELARAQELLARENRELRRDAGHRALTEPFVCESPGMRRVVAEVARVAPHQTSVLLLGESGTGKERLAQLLHYQSPRAEGPFARFNCAAVPQGLMESELFGIEAGTASGVGPRMGIFEHADGGTLFLDEIGDMEPVLQAKLLRVLQDGEVRRVGGREVSHVDVRLITATHRDIREMVARGTFREDLYFRISAVALRVPPLRERPEDILPLAEHFLAFFSEALRIPRPQLSPAFRDYLLRHPWQGNVRELRNVFEREMVMQSGAVLMPPDPARTGREENQQPLPEQVAEAESERLRRALEALGWNQTRAARSLGISEQAVRYKMRKYGIRRPGSGSA